jgi:hypothetical protein
MIFLTVFTALSKGIRLKGFAKDISSNYKEAMMLTYILLALAAIYILNRWIQFHKSKQNELPLEQIDAEFKVQLNSGDPHEP